MQDHKEIEAEKIPNIDFMHDIDELKEILLNDSNSIRLRMNSLFRLRTIASLECIKALEEALIKEKTSDLIRHEVCYCFGQMTSEDLNREEIENFLYKEVFEDPEISIF